MSEASRALRDAVTAARAAGHQWADIGTTLHADAHTAFHRYATPEERQEESARLTAAIDAAIADAAADAFEDYEPQPEDRDAPLPPAIAERLDALRSGQGQRSVVIATSHAGWGLSDEVKTQLRQRGHSDPEALPRDHPDLVEVVRRFGPDTAGGVAEWIGQPIRLAIVELPVDVDWVLETYDGAEWVAERHRRWDSRGTLADGQAPRFSDD